MAEFEKDIEAGAGIEAEVEAQTTYNVDVEAGAGVEAEVEGELIQAGQLLWEKTLVENGNDAIKAAVALQAKMSLAKLRKVSAQKKILQIQKLFLQDRVDEIKNLDEAGHIVQIWCADYTKDLTGDVGIIEVPGEQTARNIQPGYEGNAVYNAERDGQILPAIVSTPAAAFWNLAMMPGWQKWQPTFRYGTITAIDYEADTCSLDLEAAISSQQNINVNQGTALSGVPIEYMYCDSKAFEVDDVVLIKFTGQDFAAPKVIGFKSHPKRCTQWVMFECYASGYAKRYVVWDAHQADFADLSLWGGPEVAGDYPCLAADLTSWLAATSEVSTSNCYEYEAAGAGEGSYAEISPCNTGLIGTTILETSLNTGCGPLEYSRVSARPGWPSTPYDVELDAFYPAFKYSPGWPPYNPGNDWMWPAKLDKSYDLEVVAGLASEGERTCYRMEMDATYRGYGIGAHMLPPGIVSSAYDLTSTRYTPLGAMDPTIYDKTNCGAGSCALAYGNIRDKKDLDWFYPDLGIKCTGYSDTVMFQCYTVQIAQRYRTKTNFPVGDPPWVWDGDQIMFTDAQISIDYNTDITSVNPKNQTRIAALEAKVEAAMDAAAAEAGDEKCIDFMEVTIRE